MNETLIIYDFVPTKFVNAVEPIKFTYSAFLTFNLIIMTPRSIAKLRPDISRPNLFGGD